MTIVSTNHVEKEFYNQVLYCHSNAVTAIARQAILSMVEASVDMVLDGVDVNSNKNEIESSFGGVTDIAIQLVEDMCENLKTSLLEEIKKMSYTVKVTDLHYSSTTGDLEDITVACDFK